MNAWKKKKKCNTGGAKDPCTSNGKSDLAAWSCRPQRMPLFKLSFNLGPELAKLILFDLEAQGGRNNRVRIAREHIRRRSDQEGPGVVCRTTSSGIHDEASTKLEDSEP